MRDHVKSLSAFSSKLPLVELSLMVSAKGRLINVLPSSKSIQTLHLMSVSLQRGKTSLCRGMTVGDGQKVVLESSAINKLLGCPWSGRFKFSSAFVIRKHVGLTNTSNSCLPLAVGMGTEVSSLAMASGYVPSTAGSKGLLVVRPGCCSEGHAAPWCCEMCCP